MKYEQKKVISWEKVGRKQTQIYAQCALGIIKISSQVLRFLYQMQHYFKFILKKLYFTSFTSYTGIEYCTVSCKFQSRGAEKVFPANCR